MVVTMTPTATDMTITATKVLAEIAVEKGAYSIIICIKQQHTSETSNKNTLRKVSFL